MNILIALVAAAVSVTAVSVAGGAGAKLYKGWVLRKHGKVMLPSEANRAGDRVAFALMALFLFLAFLF